MFLGYPPQCYDVITKKIKPMSISIALNERQFDEMLHEMFSHLQSAYEFFTVSHGGSYKQVRIKSPVDIKNLKYSGTLVVMNQGDIHVSSSVTLSSRNLHPHTGSTAITSSANTFSLSASRNSSSLVPVTLHQSTTRTSSNSHSTSTRSSSTSIRQSTTASTRNSDTNLASASRNSSPLVPVTSHQSTTRTSSNSHSTSTRSSSTSIPQSTTASTRNSDISLLISQLRSPIDDNRLDIDEIESEREVLAKGLVEKQELLLSRDNLVQSGLSYYDDDSILNCQVVIKFFGEQGDDLEGLTKEFYSSFWNLFSNAYLKGEQQKCFTLSPQLDLTDKELLSAGRILLHGFILTGYLPIHISHEQLFYIFTGTVPSVNTMEKSFLQSLGDGDKENVMKAKQHLTEELKYSLIGLFSINEFSSIPSNESFSEDFQRMAQYVLIRKPYYILEQLRIKTNNFSSLFQSLSEELFIEVLRSKLPNGITVSKMLKPSYSSDDNRQVHEEKVFGYLETYVSSLGVTDTGKFLKFVTGLEVMSQDIDVNFNGEMNYKLMFPTAFTCTNSINLSRHYLTQACHFHVRDRVPARYHVAKIFYERKKSRW